MTTVIEKLIEAPLGAPLDKSMLLDPRIQVFDILSHNPATSYSIGELAKLTIKDRRKLQVMMNILFQYQLIEHDYNTRTYMYRDGGDSRRLKEQIEMLRAL